MGDIKVYNDAALNDNPNTVTSYNGEVTRISTFIDSLQELTDTVAENSALVQNMTQGSSENFDSFKEVEDNMSVEDFIAALNGE